MLVRLVVQGGLQEDLAWPPERRGWVGVCSRQFGSVSPAADSSIVMDGLDDR